jgi:alpha-1,3-glucosyltransferase
VANFWCSLNVVVKLRERLTIDQLSKISLLVTGLLNLPSGLDLFWRPTRSRFLVALVNSALLFFLFSFQVHEKSILLATM